MTVFISILKSSYLRTQLYQILEIYTEEEIFVPFYRAVICNNEKSKVNQTPTN